MCFHSVDCKVIIIARDLKRQVELLRGHCRVTECTFLGVSCRLHTGSYEICTKFSGVRFLLRIKVKVFRPKRYILELILTLFSFWFLVQLTYTHMLTYVTCDFNHFDENFHCSFNPEIPCNLYDHVLENQTFFLNVDLNFKITRIFSRKE